MGVLNDLLKVFWQCRMMGHVGGGGLRLGARFKALSKSEQMAVAAYAREAYERITFEQKNALPDSQNWQAGLCELIASDSKRLQSLVGAAQQNPNRVF